MQKVFCEGITYDICKHNPSTHSFCCFKHFYCLRNCSTAPTMTHWLNVHLVYERPANQNNQQPLQVWQYRDGAWSAYRECVLFILIAWNTLRLLFTRVHLRWTKGGAWWMGEGWYDGGRHALRQIKMAGAESKWASSLASQNTAVLI